MTTLSIEQTIACLQARQLDSDTEDVPMHTPCRGCGNVSGAHYNYARAGIHCGHCGNLWPCDTVVIDAALTHIKAYQLTLGLNEAFTIRKGALTDDA